MNIAKLNQICMNCFSERASGVSVCPVCGYDEAAQEESLYHIPPRSVLCGKYLIGRVLGEGGFGITYLGYDLNLDLKVAVKEYYPSGLVMRSTTVSMTVQPAGGEQGKFFAKGRERFVDEAKRLARFRMLPGIVMVSDFFVENGTAYIVMEFVEGVTLKSYMAQLGGKLPAEQVFDMLAPVVGSLAEVHQSGIIHRDISPDNIMITPDGGMKLLDFGAAREFGVDEKSLSVMLKHGYAPMEQYTTKGRQGPHTDVYALCATIYKAITGATPESAMDRSLEDSLLPPSALGVALPPHQEAALMKGLALRAENRWQTVGELQEALQSGPDCLTTSPFVIARELATEAIQKSPANMNSMDCFATLAMTEDGIPGRPSPAPQPPPKPPAERDVKDAVPYAPATKKPASKKSKTPKIIAAVVAACAVVVAIVLALTLPGTLGGNSGEDTPTGNISSNGDNTPFAETPEATPTVPPDAETPEATPTVTPDTETPEPTPTPTPEPTPEPIDYEVIEFGGYVWRVLDVQDGKALVISEDILENRIYHDFPEIDKVIDDAGRKVMQGTLDLLDNRSVTWATSDIRAYLNGEFYNSFSESDRAKIVEVTNGGADTTDKIFLLSLGEVTRYFGDRENRIAYHVGGTYIDPWGDEYTIEEGEASGWWLRQLVASDTTAIVPYDGGVPKYGIGVDWGFFHDIGGTHYIGVRPALWLILE